MNPVPQSMSGVLLTGHGGPEKLIWSDDIPVPDPGPGQALVRVHAAGVNNTDMNTRVGWYASEVTGATDEVDQEVEAGGWGGALVFPRIQGGDICGTVVALGAGVSDLAIGDRVTCPINLPRPTDDNPFGYIALGSEIDGAFAQYCVLEASDLYDVKHSPLTDAEIAAVPCAFGTAENLLSRAGVTARQSVLITGASGGVGLAAVQLAKLRHAEVIGVSSATKAEYVRAAGATVIARGDPLPQDRFNVVIDVVGGPDWADLIRALKPGGHYAVSGAIAGPIVEADLRDIYLRDITIHGCTHQPPRVFERLVSLMRSGDIRPLISKTYAMEDIAMAQQDFISKTLPGKLVLIPPEVSQ